jgi:hypothetical protein
MRYLMFVLTVAGVVAISGCGCLETSGSVLEYRVGGGGPDPNQAEWHRWLFGTTWLPALYPGPPMPLYPPDITPPSK